MTWSVVLNYLRMIGLVIGDSAIESLINAVYLANPTAADSVVVSTISDHFKSQVEHTVGKFVGDFAFPLIAGVLQSEILKCISIVKVPVSGVVTLPTNLL